MQFNFKKIVEKFAYLFYSKYVFIPTGNEMKKANEVYIRIKFLGACGSVPWTERKYGGYLVC